MRKNFSYASSRTSLEPSEFGEETSSTSTVISKSETVQEVAEENNITQVFITPTKNENPLNSTNRVAIISHQLEETYGGGAVTKNKSSIHKSSSNSENDAVTFL